MRTTAIKGRTRDEIIAAFKESIRRKNECIEQGYREFEDMRRNQVVI